MNHFRMQYLQLCGSEEGREVCVHVEMGDKKSNTF